MRVLHISDLHRTGSVSGASGSLGTIWTAIDAALRRENLREWDFVVGSGDLTQQATKEEYDQLLGFAKRKLLPLVKGDVRRVIFVPGNHDVSWSAKIAESISLSTAVPADLPGIEKAFRDSSVAPQLSDHRSVIGRYGHLELFRLGDRYQARFQPVQNFLDAFYGGKLTGHFNKKFDLMSRPQRGRDWSAHVFPEKGIAFYGWNSCHSNDKYWHGAHFNPFAVEAIQDHVTRLRRRYTDILTIAVWHHGLVSDRGRPDHLTMDHIGDLLNADFKVGFHGHTHKADQRVVDLIKDKFTVIGTGSIGADQKERPGAVANQFSVVEIVASNVKVSVFARDENFNRYDPKGHSRFDIRPSGANSAPTAANALKHLRRWEVADDGLVRTTVELEQVVSTGTIPVGTICPPYCNLKSAKAFLDQTATAVDRRALGKRIEQFTIQKSGTVGKVKWTYVLSNALALTKADLALMTPRQATYENISAGRDYQGHLVQLEANELNLEIRFPSGYTIEDPLPVVEERKILGRQETWERIESEERRCKIKVVSSRTVSLSVASPYVGFRYGVSFVPANPGKPIPYKAKALLRRLDKEFRQRVNDIGPMLPLAAIFTYGTMAQLAKVSGLGMPSEWTKSLANGNLSPSLLLGDDEAWIGYLWNEEAHMLRPVFGQFPARSWARSFATGSGVAGHAFRFSRIAAWVDGADDDSALIFEPSTTTGETTYQWLLGVPVLAEKGGPSIGVLTFGGRDATGVSRRLKELAKYLQGSRSPRERDQEKLHRDLIERVNAAFWGLVRQPNGFVNTILPSVDRRYAADVLDGLGG